MKLENIGQEFPEMPDSMRRMIGQKVAEQIDLCDAGYKGGQRKKGHRSIGYKKAAAAIAAAVLALGTTVYAGARIYQMYTEHVGTYGVKTIVPRTEDMLSEQDAGTEREANARKAYENAVIKAGYLPEGMVEADIGFQYYYEDAPWVGGISAVMYAMDTEDPFEVLDKNILDSEMIRVAGHEGTYLTRQVTDTGGISFDRILYVSYPEADLVVKLYIGQNVSREEAIKFAEGIELAEYEGTRPATCLWSEWMQEAQNPDICIHELKLQASKEEMSHTHLVGETFDLQKALAFDGDGGWDDRGLMRAEVESVQVFDDISVLKPEYLEASATDLVSGVDIDEKGRLLPNKISYLKTGDGINAVDEILKTETVNRKLVYVTVNYTNAGDTVQKDIAYMGRIVMIREKEDCFEIYDRAKQDTGEWDRTAGTGSAGIDEMMYYDVHGGPGNGGNYIDSLGPKETVAVHMGFLVNEDELGYLYLGLSPYGGSAEFNDYDLNVGYVDIRQ